MWKSIGSAIWRAATSKAGKRVLTLGGSLLVERFTKGSPKAQKLVALTAREFGRLEALAAKSGTKFDDTALEALKAGVQKEADRQLIEQTLRLLKDHAGEVNDLLNRLPLPAPKDE